MLNRFLFLIQLTNGQKAEDALKFYKGYKGKHQQEDVAISMEIETLKQIINKPENVEKFRIADLCN